MIVQAKNIQRSESYNLIWYSMTNFSFTEIYPNFIFTVGQWRKTYYQPDACRPTKTRTTLEVFHYTIVREISLFLQKVGKTHLLENTCKQHLFLLSPVESWIGSPDIRHKLFTTYNAYRRPSWTAMKSFPSNSFIPLRCFLLMDIKGTASN